MQLTASYETILTFTFDVMTVTGNRLTSVQPSSCFKSLVGKDHMT